jgi:hypothetical protein
VEISLFVLIFTSLIGILALAYTYNFRYRALSLEVESLRQALERTVRGRNRESEDISELEEPEQALSEAELSEGLKELKLRIRRAIAIAAALFLASLAACVALSVAGFKYWGIALAGISILLAGATASLVLLRDIPRAIESGPE